MKHHCAVDYGRTGLCSIPAATLLYVLLLLPFCRTPLFFFQASTGLLDDLPKRSRKSAHRTHFCALLDFAGARSVQQELTHQRAVLEEQVAQLALKWERCMEASQLSKAARTEAQAILAGMEQRTKVWLSTAVSRKHSPYVRLHVLVVVHGSHIAD